MWIHEWYSSTVSISVNVALVVWQVDVRCRASPMTVLRVAGIMGHGQGQVQRCRVVLCAGKLFFFFPFLLSVVGHVVFLTGSVTHGRITWRIPGRHGGRCPKNVG